MTEKVLCTNCEGTGYMCHICKNTGYVEIVPGVEVISPAVIIEESKEEAPRKRGRPKRK